MLKKTVTYEDPFNPGQQITEDLYFNLTKAELVEMEVGIPGEKSLKEHLEDVANSENGQQIMDAMKGIILGAYGKREGSAFLKNEKIREEFASSEAYSTLFMEMVTDADAAIVFVKGIMPKDMIEDENQGKLDVERPNLGPRKLTREEAISMDGADLQLGIKQGRYILE